MSKRSVDKGDSKKKPSTKTKEEKPGNIPTVSMENKAKAARNASAWQNNDLYIYAGLVFTAILSFALRTYIPWNRVFSGDSVIFSSETDAWYHMMLAHGTVINLQRLFFDPMTYFPHGTALHFGPLLSWAITIFSYIFGLGHPTNHLVDVVGAIMPAFMGALLVFPVYFIGRELLGKSCGLLSALIVAVLPGQLFSRSTLGFTDHHAAEVLFSTLAIMFLLLALRSGKSMSFSAVQRNLSAFKKPLMYSALAGVSLGLYIDAWSSGFLFEGIILLFLLAQSIFDHLRDKNGEYLSITGCITFLVATLMVLPFVDSYYGFNHYLYSLFQPTILLMGVVAAILFTAISRIIKEKGFPGYYYPGSLAGLVVLGTAILYIALPTFTKPLLVGLSIFQQKTGGAATVGEASALFSSGGVFSVGNVLSSFPGFGAQTLSWTIAFLLSTFTFAFIALVLIAIRNTKIQRPAEILILCWSIIILIMTLAQNRFTYYYGINVALLVGFLVIYAMQKLGFDSIDSDLFDKRNQNKQLIAIAELLAAALVIFSLIIYPSFSMSIDYANSAGGPELVWRTSTPWPQNTTPRPGMALYEK